MPETFGLPKSQDASREHLRVNFPFNILYTTVISVCFGTVIAWSFLSIMNRSLVSMLRYRFRLAEEKAALA